MVKKLIFKKRDFHPNANGENNPDDPTNSMYINLEVARFYAQKKFDKWFKKNNPTEKK